MFHVAYIVTYAASQLREYLEIDDLADAVWDFFRADNTLGGDNERTTGTPDEDGTEKWRENTEALYNGLYRVDGAFDIQHVTESLRALPAHQVLRLKDVDRYNLLEKAVIYRDIEAAKLILHGEDQNPKCTGEKLHLDENNDNIATDCHESVSDITDEREKPVKSENDETDQIQMPWTGVKSATDSSTRRSKGVTTVTSDGLSSAALLAAFLGSDQMLQMFINFDESVVIQRGALLLSQVNGPPNHLIRHKGYRNSSHFNLTDSDKIFRLNWVKTHQNEPPINLAICGDEPTTMMCLLEHFAKQTPEEERGELSDETLRTIFGCGSTKCLEALVGVYPETLRTRDHHGWLYAGYGLQHGTTFLASLAFQNGFDVSLLNDIDGQRSLNALHVFYDSITRADFNFRKFQDLYDMTEVLLELGVDVNMTTSAYSYGTELTCLHLLMDIVNLVIVKDPSILRTLNCVSSLDSVTRLQKDFDNGIKDAAYYILSSGYQLRERITDVIQRLFQNRHIVQRVSAVTSSRSSIQMACFSERLCGFRDIYLISSLILEYCPNLKLTPQRRQLTSLYSFVDTLANIEVFNYLVSHIDVFGVFFDTIDLLLKHGDNPNIYPYNSPDDSYRVIPLIHFLDIYLSQWNMGNAAHTARSFEYVLRVIECFCKYDSKTTCVICHQGKHIRRSAFDSYRLVFQAVLTDLHERKDDVLVAHRLDMMRSLLQLMVPYGADTLIECEMRRIPHTTTHNLEVVGPSRESLLGQCLMAAVQSATLLNDTHKSMDIPSSPENMNVVEEPEEMISVWDMEEYQDLLDILLGEAEHSLYYSTIHAVITFCDQMPKSEEKPAEDSDQVDEVTYIKEQICNLNCVRPLKHLCRSCLRPCLSNNYLPYIRRLNLPKILEEFLLFRIG